MNFPLGFFREVLDAAGGMLPGRQFKACYPGGSSCALLTAADLDISMDFEYTSSSAIRLWELPLSLSWMIRQIW